ncbi:MAG: PilZ domain-containing protein [Pseudomonadota bacterium]
MNELEERRGEKRFDCHAPLSVQYTDFGKAHTARALNLSEGGIAFETDHPLQVGAIVYIKKGRRANLDRLVADCLFLRLSSFATVRWVCGNGANGAPGYAVGAENFVYGCFY